MRVKSARGPREAPEASAERMRTAAERGASGGGAPRGVRMPAGPDKTPEKIAGMFDAIAGRYDLLNHLLSLGIDRRWRRRAIESLALRPGERVLDLCTGTADLAIEAASRTGRPHQASGGDTRVVGIDFASEMLRLARKKLASRAEHRVTVVRADAMRIPLRDASVDAVTIGFGIRNVQRPEIAARDIFRVLRPGGRLAILEFGTPSAPGLRGAYLFYFRRILPMVGRLVSRHNEAYGYLPASVAAFPSPDDFLTLLSSAGFSDVRVARLTFGIVYLFTGRKERQRPGREAKLIADSE
jgi:demethylmenaquinone methyltransferase/2-methoxy-6-polyprenyl-1,4-benzoquinol methylase